MSPTTFEGDRAKRRSRRRHKRRTRLLATCAAVGAVIGAVFVASSRVDRRSDAQRVDSGPGVETSVSATSSLTSAPTNLGPLANRRVLIDPGHNGANVEHTAEISRLVDIGTQQRACDTPGTRTDGGYTEAEYNFDVAMRVAGMLRERGATVVMTRDSNEGWGPCIDERAAIGNRAAVEVAVSIHADGGPVTGRGFHVIFPPSIPGLTDDIAAESRVLALIVREDFGTVTGMPRADYIADDALSERSDLGGLNLSDVPKVFVECGNMRNPVDALLLQDPAFRAKVSEAIVASITKYLGP